MSEKQVSLWWAYDSTEGRFAALPASPLLLPVLLFMGALSIGKAILSPTRMTGQGLGPITKTDYYQRQYKRWRELGRRAYVNGEDLEWHEWEEYYKLQKYVSNPYGHKR